MSLMGGDALGPGQITVALVRRGFGQGKPDYFSYPSPSCFFEMGDPGQYHFDGTRGVNCAGGIILVRTGQWDLHAVFLRSQGFGWANTGPAKSITLEMMPAS